MNSSRFEQLFQKIATLRVGVIGDFAVDFYYAIQTATDEFSLETTHEVHWANSPKTSLGAAGNVVQNVEALGVGHLEVFGFTGKDIYGREMRHLFQSLNVNTESLQALSGIDTCTYTKPMRGGEEQNRIDFGTHNQVSEDDFQKILNFLSARLPQLDVLLINQQFPNPLLTPNRLEKLNELLKTHTQVQYVADLRSFGAAIRGATLKVNVAELARILAVKEVENTDTWCLKNAQQLQEIIAAPVLVTRGEQGILWVNNSSDNADFCHVKGFPLTSPLDTVGAGDTVLAAFAVAKAVEATPQEALQIANAAAAVTVQKLHQTGTATPQEISKILL